MESVCTVGWQEGRLRSLPDYAKRGMLKLGSEAFSLQQLLDGAPKFLCFCGKSVQRNFCLQVKVEAEFKEVEQGHFWNLDIKIEMLVADVNTSDEVAGYRSLTEEEVSSRRQITKDLYQACLSKTSLLFQKSRVKWPKRVMQTPLFSTRVLTFEEGGTRSLQSLWETLGSKVWQMLDER